jgi:putative hydrolase of the HAD superfamily
LSIKAVLFDLDETLLDRNATVEAYLKDQYRRYNLNHLPFEAYRDRFIELDEHGYADKQKVFGTLIKEFDLSASIEELVADFRQNAWRDCQTFSDAERVLRQLRTRGYRLGIVTNGSSESQRAKLLSSGLAGLVEEVLISAEEKVKKPDVEIFARAAERLGARAEECLFVGDNPQTDIGGAHAAGMQTAWLKRYLAWPEDLSVVPDYTPSGLAELLAIAF